MDEFLRAPSEGVLERGQASKTIDSTGAKKTGIVCESAIGEGEEATGDDESETLRRAPRSLGPVTEQRNS